MQNFFEWFSSIPEYSQTPWLIMGKGPSFSRLEEFDTSLFARISLNHVVREQKVDIAHMIDFDVAQDCAALLYKNAKVMVLPWIPHEKNWAGKRNLEELTESVPLLKKMNEEGRVKFYNFGSSDIRNGESLVIPPSYFSSEAVVNLLTAAGVKKIRTIGIDGGVQYSDKFSDLRDKTLLNNGHVSFDLQFTSIAKKIMKENLDFAPLDLQVPVKIYVGSMEEQMIPVKVLEYSIKKHSSLPVQVTPLFKGGIHIPMPKDEKNKPRTPFSFQRFIIPQLNGYKGKAIYVDSDMQVFTDIRNLWERDMQDAEILSAYDTSGTGRRPQYSVMVIDCEKLQWDINVIVKKLDIGELTYDQLLYEMKVADKINPAIEAEWNSLEHYEEGKTKLLHYTDMGRQPWLFKVNPLSTIWVQSLNEAIGEGFISLNEFKDHLLAGNIRPSLWIQIRKKRFDLRQIPKLLLQVDRFFVAPHQLRPSTSKLKLAMNRLIVKTLFRVL